MENGSPGGAGEYAGIPTRPQWRGVTPNACSAQVPEASFAELRDHRREARGRIAPVRLDGDLGRARIARRDAANDRVVLLHGRRQLVEKHADVEARVALDLRLDHTVEREEPRSDHPLDVRAVELEVELEDARLIAALLGREPEGLVDLAKPADEDAPSIGGKRRGLARGQPLEVADDEQKLTAVALGKWRDDEPLVSADARRGDESLLL